MLIGYKIRRHIYESHAFQANHVLSLNSINLLEFHECVMFRSQQTQNICITFIQRRPNVFDVGPTLHKVVQMFSVYWVSTSKYAVKLKKTPFLACDKSLHTSDIILVALLTAILC